MTLGPTTLWIDCEVHVLPPEWCAADFRPPKGEDVLMRVLYDHPERDLALDRADGAGLAREMARAGVDRAVITGLPWKSDEMNRVNTAYVARLARENPGRFYPVGLLPDPFGGADPIAAVEDMAETLGCLGVKVIPSWQGWRLDDPRLAPVWDRMIELGLFLMPHTDQPYREIAISDPPQALFTVASRHRDLRILAPHLGGGLAQACLHPPVKAVLGNILFVGSVPTSMPAVRHALEAVGPDRVCFGTDFPFNPSHDQRTVKGALLDLNLPEAWARAVAGESAAAWLGPPVGAVP
jgi:predicted TIM-barrel fold metal-dependent hydrolase